MLNEDTVSKNTSKQPQASPPPISPQKAKENPITVVIRDEKPDNHSSSSGTSSHQEDGSGSSGSGSDDENGSSGDSENENGSDSDEPEDENDNTVEEG